MTPFFCYNELARISHQLVRYLEAAGYQAVAVPAFLPLDMGDGTMGLVGAIDWKQETPTIAGPAKVAVRWAAYLLLYARLAGSDSLGNEIMITAPMYQILTRWNRAP